jgi:tetratricopeptide (TPR) repeat protein
VVDAAGERALVRWPGSASVQQIERLLDQGELAARSAAPATIAPPAERTVEEEVLSALSARDHERCARAAVAGAPSLPRGPSFANVAVTGLHCAQASPKEAAWRAGAIATLEPLTALALSLPGLLADDRSGIYEVLIDARTEAGDAAGAKALAGKWLAFLEEEAARAPSPEARAAFDPHRVVAAMKLGDPGRAIPALLASEKDLPADYNAPARLAVIYKELRRWEEAVAAIDRALARAYGPRRIRLLETKASIQQACCDEASSQTTLREALRAAEALPASQGRDDIVARVRKRLK